MKHYNDFLIVGIDHGYGNIKTANTVTPTGITNTTTFRKAGLAKNTAYKFRVRAYHMSGKTALYGNYGSVSGKTAAK